MVLNDSKHKQLMQLLSTTSRHLEDVQKLVLPFGRADLREGGRILNFENPRL